MKAGVDVNVNMLTWAIDRAGYSMDELTHQFPKLPDWIANTRKPTRKQLEDFSHKVHLPFGYLFLQKPPAESIPFPFFRSNSASTQEVSLNLYDTILLIQRRQDWLTEYLREIKYEELPFVGKFNQQTNPLRIVDDIRKYLQLDEQWACNFSTTDNALNHLTERIEEIGIVVTFNGVVENNNYRHLEVKECRGFVMVDRLAPFMFVNNADGKAAQMFTLLHELAHIWIGESAGFENGKLLPANSPIEILCDKVAAEFLVPEKAFSEKWTQYKDVDKLSRHFKVSRIVIARRALDLNKISKAAFFQFYNNYTQEILHKKEGQSSGGNFYATQKKRVGVRFAGFVDRAVNENKLLFRDAYKLTGLRGDTYQKFITQTLY